MVGAIMGVALLLVLAVYAFLGGGETGSIPDRATWFFYLIAFFGTPLTFVSSFLLVLWPEGPESLFYLSGFILLVAFVVNWTLIGLLGGIVVGVMQRRRRSQP